MVRWLERFLWIVAVAAVSVYIGSVGESRLSQAYLDWEFTRAVELPVRVATRTDVIPFVAQPLGRLEIPSIALSTIFIEGVDDRALRRGVGHIPGTALPGMPGNVGLSAHRDTFSVVSGKSLTAMQSGSPRPMEPMNILSSLRAWLILMNASSFATSAGRR